MIRFDSLFSTYSIVARDAQTGQMGVAVQTHQLSVGRIVPWLEPGVGALATQSLANAAFGPMGLTMLAQGVEAARVIDALVATDPEADRRQVAVVDAQGRAAAWTGNGCIAEAGHHVGEGYSVQANMMTRSTVIAAMRSEYEQASGDLAARMLAALYAAQAEDGDIRGMQSAALVIVPADRTVPEIQRTLYNLRVDEHDEPLKALDRLVRLRRAQLISSQGDEALEAGDQTRALALWAQARELAPELEEMAFWQAVELADYTGEATIAAAILRDGLAGEKRRDHWLDLIHRLETCGLIQRKGTAEALIKAL
jgi:uncharacterized Ntn-hydrolase superfamily protein